MEPTMSGSGMEANGGTPLGGAVRIDDGRIQAHLDEVVRSTVEEALNALLDAEADHLCGARKYERTEGCKDTRAGSYTRQLHDENRSTQSCNRTSIRPAVSRSIRF